MYHIAWHSMLVEGIAFMVIGVLIAVAFRLYVNRISKSTKDTKDSSANTLRKD